MQIICPHCTTSYAIDPTKFGDAGRKVRCARCQQIWLARPELVAVTTAHDFYAADARDSHDARHHRHDDDTPHVQSPSISADWPDPRIGQTQERSDSDWPASAQRDEADQEPGRSRSRFAKLRQPFRMPPKLMTAIPPVNLKTACAMMGAMVVGLMIWRAEVVRLMPQTAAFFKMVGMGVNLRGLAFEDLKITTETVNNKPVLLLEGALVDVTRRSVEIPRLRFIVRDAKGTDIYAWNAVLEQPVLNPGEKAYFKTRLAAPPAEGREIAVRFFHKMDIAAGGT